MTAVGRRPRGRTLSKRELDREANRQRKAGSTSRRPMREVERPQVRGDCASVARPCPHVSCRYNLFMEVKGNGNIKLNRGDDVGALLNDYASCALDVAADGARSLEEVAQLLNMTRERVRQLEDVALQKLQQTAHQAKLDPGQLHMLDEIYTQAPASEAMDQLGLGEDKEWLTRLCNRADVLGETWTL